MGACRSTGEGGDKVQGGACGNVPADLLALAKALGHAIAQSPPSQPARLLLVR